MSIDLSPVRDILQADGGDIVQLTTPQDGSDPAWSPVRS